MKIRIELWTSKTSSPSVYVVNLGGYIKTFATSSAADRYLNKMGYTYLYETGEYEKTLKSDAEVGLHRMYSQYIPA